MQAVTSSERYMRYSATDAMSSDRPLYDPGLRCCPPAPSTELVAANPASTGDSRLSVQAKVVRDGINRIRERREID